MYTIQLIHWNPKEGEEKVALIESAGFRVVARPLTSSFLKELRSETPDAVVIDLTRLPSAGRDVGAAISSDKTLRSLPLVFVDGDPQKVMRIRELLPHAVYTSWTQLSKSVHKAIKNPNVAKSPPGGIMAAYRGVPLYRKLGIEANWTVVLVDAPSGWENELSQRPEGLRLLRNSRARRDLTIWFVASRDVLKKKAGIMAKWADQGPIWIAWPKKGGRRKSDLTQVIVRRTAESGGLVDYKICSIDKTWSGLLFTWSKKKKS